MHFEKNISCAKYSGKRLHLLDDAREVLQTEVFSSYMSFQVGLPRMKAHRTEISPCDCGKQREFCGGVMNTKTTTIKGRTADTQGGMHEQHVKAGQQSNENDKAGANQRRKHCF